MYFLFCLLLPVPIISYFDRISTQGDAAVVLFHCKEQMIAARGCRTTQYQGKINKVHLAQFVQAQRIPKYVSFLLGINVPLKLCLYSFSFNVVIKILSRKPIGKTSHCLSVL